MGFVLHAEVELIPEYLWDFSPGMCVHAYRKIAPYFTWEMLVKTVLYPVGKDVIIIHGTQTDGTTRERAGENPTRRSIFPNVSCPNQNETK